MAAPTPPPDDTDMILFADESADRATPPPRLAARFHRNTSSRRRSSAHSSRRSSLSSIHSHHSSVSCHGGPRSTHVAQHLRRASIIENRKARLADRAAHAEQVRLRAAAAKAATKVSYSEEKALAAQAAREKLLAEIAARCEEEVRRAKKIAEETKEKKAAENARLREEMAEKFADAARRKTIYQSSLRRPRTTSLAAVEEKKVNPATLRKLGRITAAKVIQKAWRKYVTGKIVTSFTSLHLNLSHVSNQSFEEVTSLISEEKTIQATSKLLKLLGIAPTDDNDTSSTGPVRMFLSAYLILSHPMQALSHGGGQPQEQELVTKSAALIEPFEIYIEHCAEEQTNKTASNHRDDLLFAYNDFSAAFQAWKSQDLETIVDVMVASFVNLDLIIQSTKNDEDGRVGEDYLTAVRQEQIKLLANLKKLAGSENALNRVRAAVRKARKQRALEMKEKRQTEQHVPRAVTPVDQKMDTQPPLTPPTTPRQSSSKRESAPASFITRLGQTMTVLPSNREIAHEMQINGSFEVQQQPWTDSRKHFMDALRSSMQESMQSCGAQTAAAWTHSMAVLIREKLLNLISQRHPLYDRIDGFLDPKLIDQQCRNGAFSYPSFFDTIAVLIAQVCSPGRDDAVKAFASDTTSSTIDRLFSLIDIVDLMTLDHINFQFRMATRSVLEHGHEHEHSMFERDLQSNVHSLERTKRWWTNAKLAVATSNSNGNAVYSRGLVDLVFQNSHLTYDQVPETLRLDYIRLLKLRAKALQIVSLSSILLTTKLRLQRNREALWTNDKERLMSVDLVSADTARIISLIETSHRMPDSTKEGIRNFVSRALPPAVAATRNVATAEQERLACMQQQTHYDPATTSNMSVEDTFAEQIATYVLKSLREHVFARLSAGSTAEKVRATTSAAEVLSRAGMPEFVNDVGSLVDVLERVRGVDLKAHGKWYDEVVQESGS